MNTDEFPILLTLPSDIILGIIIKFNDPLTLRNLILAYPDLQFFMQSDFSYMLRIISSNNLESPQLYRYVFAIMAAHYMNIQRSLYRFLCYFINKGDGNLLLPPYIPRSMDTLLYMSEVLNAVDFYLSYGKRLWDRAIVNQNYPPGYPSATSLVIRTCLLRLQLYTEIFHQPLDISDSVDNWEADLLLLQDYWDFYESMKCLRLCKFLFAAIAVSVGHEIEHKILPPMDTTPDTLCLRGLPQTKLFMEGGTYTAFGLSYVRRFVQRNVSMMELLDSNAAAWASYWAIRIIFSWDDGPHGGLGTTTKGRLYTYTGVPYEGHAGYLAEEAIIMDDNSVDEEIYE